MLVSLLHNRGLIDEGVQVSLFAQEEKMEACASGIQGQATVLMLCKVSVLEVHQLNRRN